MVELEKRAAKLENSRRLDVSHIARKAGRLGMALVGGVASSVIYSAISPNVTVVNRTTNNYYGAAQKPGKIDTGLPRHSDGSTHVAAPNGELGSVAKNDEGRSHNSVPSASSGSVHNTNSAVISNNVQLCIRDMYGTHC